MADREGFALRLGNNTTYTVRTCDHITVIVVAVLLVEIACSDIGIVFFGYAYSPLACVTTAVIYKFSYLLTCHITAYGKLGKNYDIRFRKFLNKPLDICFSAF